MRIFLFLMCFILGFGYELSVNNQKDAQKLENIGFSCNKQNGLYLCLGSNDLNELRRIQDFLKTKFNIKTEILKDINDVPIEKKITSTTSKRVEKKFSEENLSIAKSGYCIQLGTFRRLKSAKELYSKYKNHALTRIEKIGPYYVVRSGEGSFRQMKNLTYNLKGIVKRCDIIPQRIIISNLNLNTITDNSTTANENIDNNNIAVGEGINSASKLNAMYYYLNSGNLIKAKELALSLKNIYPQDAYLVLAIVNMKNQNFEKACKILSKLNSKKAYKLKKDACYTFYLKKGFNILPKSPQTSLSFFKKALSLKSTLSAKIGEAYAYLNAGYPQKAYVIFKDLYKKNPNNKKVIQGYANTLYTLKKFDELRALQDKLPPKLKEELSSINFYIKLKKAQNFINESKYKDAENILLNLYIQKPDDVNLLLSLGNLYLHMNQVDKAQNFYNNVLVVSPNNIYALEGLEAVYMKKKDFKSALKYSDKIVALGFEDVNRKMVQELYYLNLSNFYLNKNNVNKASQYLKKLQKIAPNDPFVLALTGDIYFKQNRNRLAYKYYAKAYSLAPNNFGISLKFLYALLNLNLYDQIKIILGKIDTTKLTPEQKDKLRKFYITLYAKYSSYLLKNGDYKKAFEVVNRGLEMDNNNFNLLSNKAWICMKLKNYECANKYFKKALLLKNDNVLKYGLALSYINLGKKDKAKEILDSIKTNDKNLEIKIAGAYVQLGDIEKANRILKGTKPEIKIDEMPKKEFKDDINENINPSQNKNDFFPNPFLDSNIKNNTSLNSPNVSPVINNKHNKLFLEDYSVKKKIVLKKNLLLFKEYSNIKKEIQNIEQNYISNLGIGVKLRNKSGEKGLSQLTRISFPYVRGNIFLHRNKLYFILDPISLNSGKLINYNKIGTPSEINATTQPFTTAYGISPKIGFEIGGEKYFLLQIGTTPLGTDIIHSTLTGRLKFGLNKNEKKFFVNLYRKSVKDSITSYVGNKDPFTGKKWGRVTANGIKIEFQKGFDKNGSMLYADLAYENLKGVNTASNSDISSEMLGLFYIGDALLDEDYFGFYSNILHFNKNQNDFYFGSGGYFSPKIFFSIAPRYEGYFFSKNKKFISKFMLMIGGSYINNWDNPKLNFAFDTGISSEYLLLNNLALEGGLDYRNSKNYNDFFFTLMLKYYFGKKLYFNKKDIDNFSKKVIQW